MSDVVVKSRTTIYLVTSRYSGDRTNWPDRAFPSKAAAQDYIRVKNRESSKQFYIVSPITLESVL